MQEGQLLNLADWVAPSWANGPGARAVVFVQGCGIGCPGCRNSHTWAREPRHLVTIDALVEWYGQRPGLRGLTLSGGEPFEQAEALAELCRRVRAAGADVIAYSGFEYEALRAGVVPHAPALLTAIDLLIDGPFRQDLPCALPLRGSGNQRLHFLTSRIEPRELEGLPRAEWIGGAASSRITGFQVGSLLAALAPGGDRP